MSILCSLDKYGQTIFRFILIYGTKFKMLYSGLMVSFALVQIISGSVICR